MFKHLAASAMVCATILTSTAYAEEALDPELLFKEAMELRESGKVFDSIKVFETILSDQPGLNRARLELGIAYHQARRFQDARDQLTKVLNDPETPESVKLSITGYLAQLGSDEKISAKRTSSSFYISAGIFNDSNVTLGPSAETASSGSTTEKTGGGIVGMLSFSHSSRSSSPIKSGDNLIDFEWNTQFTAYDKSYTTSTESDYNVQLISLKTGPALVLKENWEFQFNFKLDKIFFAGNPYSSNVGLNPLLKLTFANDLELSFESLLSVNEYDSGNEGLDGISKMYDFGISKFFKKQTTGINGGIRYHSNGADDGSLNSTGTEIYLGSQMNVWKNGLAYINLSSRKYEYKAAGTGTGGIIRDETESKLTIGVSHNFKSGTLKSWALNGQVSYKDNDSNVTSFNYDQLVSEVNLRRYF